MSLHARVHKKGESRMRVLRPLGIIATLLLPIAIAQGQIRSYNANFTSTAPTIDGTLSAGEWDIADSVGDWTLLRTPNGGDPNAEDLSLIHI